MQEFPQLLSTCKILLSLSYLIDMQGHVSETNTQDSNKNSNNNNTRQHSFTFVFIFLIYATRNAEMQLINIK